LTDSQTEKPSASSEEAGKREKLCIQRTRQKKRKGDNSVREREKKGEVGCSRSSTKEAKREEQLTEGQPRQKKEETKTSNSRGGAKVGSATQM